jgi:hypothetical protein
MGGYGESVWLNDVWFYSLKHQSWCPANIWNRAIRMETTTCTRSGAGHESNWPIEWRKVPTSFELPSARAAHSLTAIPVQAWARAIEAAKSKPQPPQPDDLNEEVCAILFGGNDGSGVFNDVWLLRQVPAVDDDIIEFCGHSPLVWLKPIVVGDTPCPRAGHSAVLFGASMIVFGGSRGWGTDAFNDLHVLDVGNVRPWCGPSWLEDEAGLDAESLVFWYSPIVAGQPPSARAGHTASVIGNNMLVFGGADSSQCFNDIHVLQCSTFTWSSPVCSGPVPCARSGTASVAVGDTLVIFGGSSFTGELMGDVLLLETDFLGRTTTGTRHFSKVSDVVKPNSTISSASSKHAFNSKQLSVRPKREPTSLQLEKGNHSANTMRMQVQAAYSNWAAGWRDLKQRMAIAESAQQQRFEQLMKQV